MVTLYNFYFLKTGKKKNMKPLYKTRDIYGNEVTQELDSLQQLVNKIKELQSQRDMYEYAYAIYYHTEIGMTAYDALKEEHYPGLSPQWITTEYMRRKRPIRYVGKFDMRKAEVIDVSTKKTNGRKKVSKVDVGELDTEE
jgi:pterin-4a-carbinolamine dehydratase